MECDHRILVGGIVFHFLAGFGGGRKMVLPWNLQQKYDQHRP